jgi:hypothetical protein
MKKIKISENNFKIIVKKLIKENLENQRQLLNQRKLDFQKQLSNINIMVNNGYSDGLNRSYNNITMFTFHSQTFDNNNIPDGFRLILTDEGKRDSFNIRYNSINNKFELWKANNSYLIDKENINILIKIITKALDYIQEDTNSFFNPKIINFLTKGSNENQIVV